MGLGPYPLISLAEARERVTNGASCGSTASIPSRHGAASGRRNGWRRRSRSRSASVPTATSRRMSQGGRTPSTGTSGGRRWTSPARPWATCRWRAWTPRSLSKRWSRSGPRSRRRHRGCAGASRRCWIGRPPVNYRTGRQPGTMARAPRQAAAENLQAARVQHHPALPYVDLPQFMVELRANPSISARALEFTILTAAGPTKDQRQVGRVRLGPKRGRSRPSG